MLAKGRVFAIVRRSRALLRMTFARIGTDEFRYAGVRNLFSCSSLSRAGCCVRGTGEYRAFLLVCNLFFMRSRAWPLSHCCWPWRCSTGGRPPDVPFFRGSRANGKASSRWTALHVALLAFFKYYEFSFWAWNRWQRRRARHRHPAPCVALDGDPVPRRAVFFTRSRGCPTPSIITAARTSRRARFWTCCCSCPSSPRSWRGPIMRARQFLPQLGHWTWIPATCRKGSRLSSAGCSRRS